MNAFFEKCFKSEGSIYPGFTEHSLKLIMGWCSVSTNQKDLFMNHGKRQEWIKAAINYERR